MPKIIEKRLLTPITKMFRFEAPMIASAARPGQFVIVRVREGGERIPLTIADFDAKSGTVTIVVQEVGVTSRLLGAHEEGDNILDVLGPLGEAAHVPPGGHVVGVGGGFGSAALWCLMREFKERGDRTSIILGARHDHLLLLIDELREVCDNLLLCTDDGSVGLKGFVTEQLQQLIDGKGPGKPDHVIAIGPMPMMRAIANTTRDTGIATQVSMDPLMVDGTGMCGCCRVSVGNEVKFACVDGPLFDASKVDFDEAVKRNKIYVKDEKRAAECQRIQGGISHAS
jgi:ferredoxin--NADP+ reductase